MNQVARTERWNVVKVPSVRKLYEIRNRQQVQVTEDFIAIQAYKQVTTDDGDYDWVPVVEQYKLTECEFYYNPEIFTFDE